jgi:hypothetical protein
MLVAADRSGEADFVRMLEGCARLANAQISISKGVRVWSGVCLQADALWYISYAKRNVFRISMGDYWGSEYPTYISDGKTLLQTGSLSVLQAAPKDLASLGGTFSRGGPGYSPFIDFVRGRAALDLVGPDGNITKKGSVLVVQTKDLGELEITTTNIGGLSLPLIVDVKNIAARMASYRLFPMWYERPEDPLERYSFTYRFVNSFPKNEFRTVPPKGIPVEDRRKKG